MVTIPFTNKYALSPAVLSGEDNLAVKKDLSGRAWQNDDEFTFTLGPAAASVEQGSATADAIQNGTVVLPENAKQGITIKDDTDKHTASFGDIEFKAAGTYVFAVKEAVPNNATNADVPGKTYGGADTTDDERAKAGWMLDGVIYDTEPHNILVEVRKDVSNNTLVIDQVIDQQNITGANPAFTFTNTYKTNVFVGVPDGLEFSKSLENSTWQDDQSFVFQLKPTGGTVDGKIIDASEVPMPLADEGAGVMVSADGSATKTVTKPVAGNV